MQNEIGVVLGRKGTGKTTNARQWIETTKRNLVLDTLGDDYTAGVLCTDLVVLVETYNRLIPFDDFCIIFRPKSDADCQGFFRLAVRARNVWVWVDEVDRYCNPWKCNEDLRWILNYGRHRGLSLVGIARRAAGVHRDLTSQADWLAVHQQREKTDLNYLATLMDVSRVPGLAVGKYIVSGESKTLSLKGGE